MNVDLEVVHVTVGTTKFEALINEITSQPALHILKSRGCRKLILQSGIGALVNADEIRNLYGIEVEQYQFKYETPRTDIQKASLVIGHAGAGTCMDILSEGKPGLIIVNADLMDNHQLELALQLAEEGYIYYCNVSQLTKCLKRLDFGALQTYTPTTAEKSLGKFVDCLNSLMYDAFYQI